MNEPLVSVIVSTYNEEKYIRESIYSVLNQTYSNIEIILIDDGSTDDTVKIVKSISDKRIRLYINEKNQKLAHNLNFGISVANGKYIARMDADDLARKDRISEQVSFMESHGDVDVLATYAKTFGNSTLVKKTPIQHNDIYATLLFTNPICHPTVMFRKSSLDYQYDEICSAGQDYELWARIVDKKRFAAIDKILLDYRVVDRQKRKEYLQIQKESGLKARRHIFNRLFGDDGEQYWNIFSKLVDIDFYDFHPKTESQMQELICLANKIIEKNDNKCIFNNQSLWEAVSDILFRQWYVSLGKTDISVSSLLESAYRKVIGQQELSVRLKTIYKIIRARFT